MLVPMHLLTSLSADTGVMGLWSVLRTPASLGCLILLLTTLLASRLGWICISRQRRFEQQLAQLQARILAIRKQPSLALLPQGYADDVVGALAKNVDLLMRDWLCAEARYQSGAEELRDATNSGLDAFFIFQARRNTAEVTCDFIIRYLNSNGAKLLSVSPVNPLQQSLLDTFAGHLVAVLFDKYVAVMGSGLPLQEEICFPVPDGSTQATDLTRWFLYQIVPQADGVALTLRDITERKRSELEIRSNRAFLQSLTDHLPMLFYAKRMRPDGRGAIVNWNRAAESITGFQSVNMLGKTDRESQPAHLADLYEAHDRVILASLVPLDIPETRFQRPDGTIRYLHLMSVPIFDETGAVEYIIGIGEDISERRRQERSLRNNQAVLQAVNDASPLGLFMTDLAGNLTYINKAYERMAGRDAHALIGSPWSGALHSDDQEMAIAGWVAAIRQQQTFQSVHRLHQPDATVVFGAFKAVATRLDEQITGYVGSVDDITLRLEVERALRASEQRLRLVTDNIPALISYVRPDQHFEFGNGKYQAAYGLRQSSISGMSQQAVLGPDVYAQSAPYIEDALQGRPANFERLVTHVGPLRWERVRYVPDIDEAAQVVGFFSLSEDITELKQAQHTFAKSEMRLRMITDNLPALIAYIDHDWRYRFCNGHHDTILGLKPDRILGLHVEEVVSPGHFEATKEQIAMVLDGERLSFERQVVSQEGVAQHFQFDYIPDIGADGAVAGFYSMVLDITARKNAELQQAEGEKLLRTLTDNLPALVSMIDSNERFQFNNQVHVQWLGRPLSDITGHTMREVYGEKNYLLYKPYFDQALKGNKIEFEFETQHDGSSLFYRVAYAPQLDSDNVTTGVCCMVSDITALKKVEHQLRLLARFDTLTGLPNRNQFEEILDEALARSSRTGQPVAVMFLDIDHFKNINDTLGHHGGDDVLREFAQRLQQCVRKTDTVSRLAGDEFTIIVEGLQDDQEVRVIAAKILRAMREPFLIGTTYRSVTTSIGIATRRGDEPSAESLLRRADKALYAAKASGRNTYEAIV